MSVIHPTINFFDYVSEVKGVKLATVNAGIKYQDRDDLLLVTFPKDTSVAGCFTTSSITAPSIPWCRKIAENGKISALIVNSGNANCFTGREGEDAIDVVTASLADQMQCPQKEIMFASTGVIGEILDSEKILNNLPKLIRNLSGVGYDKAAKAITTTDTKIKTATKFTHIGGAPITINAIAKGSGMAAPNMATVLVYVFTNAMIPSKMLQDIWSDVVSKTLNCVTIDGDTSTNDMAVIFATGQSSQKKEVKYKNALNDFAIALYDVLENIAKLIVKDGEGVTKFLTVKVTGAKTEGAAHNIAMSIANSPLVKTAINGSDPNWGRIIMAVGKSKEQVNLDELSLKIGDTLVAKRGALVEDYNESETTAPYMKGKDIEITVDVGVTSGKGNDATIWGCDLSHGYIDINADYRS